MEQTNIVREVIADEIALHGKVSKHYVLELIGYQIHPIKVRNAAYRYAPGKVTDDGISNLRVGCNAIFRQAMKGLSRHYQIDLDGWITPRLQEQHEEQRI